MKEASDAEAKWILGGRFILWKNTGKFGDMPFEGMANEGYRPPLPKKFSLPGAEGIVGGTPVTGDDWEDVAAVVFNNSYVGCTGTLIAPDLVLTAADAGALRNDVTIRLTATDLGGDVANVNYTEAGGVRVDHRGGNIGMSEQFLHRPAVRTGLQQVRSERVA